MRVVNKSFKPSSSQDIAAMKAALQGKPFETFDDLRSNVDTFALMKDGELHQVALDAGFAVD